MLTSNAITERFLGTTGPRCHKNKFAQMRFTRVDNSCGAEIGGPATLQLPVEQVPVRCVKRPRNNTPRKRKRTPRSACRHFQTRRSVTYLQAVTPKISWVVNNSRTITWTTGNAKWTTVCPCGTQWPRSANEIFLGVFPAD